MYSLLYQKTNYLAPIDYIISAYIREYDISKANISILLEAGIITKPEYDYFYNLPRMERQINIGLMIKNDPNITEILSQGIIDAKKMFFEANQIEDHHILSIKNDAVFLLNLNPIYTDFGNIKFVCKNTYTSFYKILRKEYYYYIDNISKVENLDIKGISDSVLDKHKEYFLDFLLTIFDVAQNYCIESVLDTLTSFYESYTNKQLDIGYYRRFDSESMYDIMHTRYSSFRSNILSNQDKDYVDISYNLRILTELNKIFSGIYFRTRTLGYK